MNSSSNSLIVASFIGYVIGHVKTEKIQKEWDIIAQQLQMNTHVYWLYAGLTQTKTDFNVKGLLICMVNQHN